MLCLVTALRKKSRRIHEEGPACALTKINTEGKHARKKGKQWGTVTEVPDKESRKEGRSSRRKRESKEEKEHADSCPVQVAVKREAPTQPCFRAARHTHRHSINNEGLWRLFQSRPPPCLHWRPVRPWQHLKPERTQHRAAEHHGERRQRHGHGILESVPRALQEQQLLSELHWQRFGLCGREMRGGPQRTFGPHGRRHEPGYHSDCHHGSLLHSVRGGAGGKRAGHVHHCQVGVLPIYLLHVTVMFWPFCQQTPKHEVLWL